MPVLPFTSHINNTAIEALYTDYPLNWTLSLALFCIGDAGILADVHQYQSSFLKLKYLKKKNECVSRLLITIHKEQESLNEKIQQFLNEIVGIRKRLIDSRILSQLGPIYWQLVVQGTVMNYVHHYHMTVGHCM